MPPRCHRARGACECRYHIFTPKSMKASTPSLTHGLATLLRCSAVAQLRQCTGARCRIRTIPTFQLGTRGVPSRSRISSASAPTLGAHRSSSLTPARPRLVLVSVLVPACGPCAVNSLRRLVRSALVCLCPSVCGRTGLSCMRVLWVLSGGIVLTPRQHIPQWSAWVESYPFTLYSLCLYTYYNAYR